MCFVKASCDKSCQQIQQHCDMHSPGQEEANVLHITPQREHRTVKTKRVRRIFSAFSALNVTFAHLWQCLKTLLQYIGVLVPCVIVCIFSALPENTGEFVCGQVMDKHQVSQAGQRLFRITYLLLQEAWNLFSLQQMLIHETGEGLTDCTESVL